MEKTDYILSYGKQPESLLIDLPASKSISNRALTIDALTGFRCSIDNIADCDDTAAVHSALAAKGSDINIGAAGTAMRFLTALFAAKEGRNITLDGSPRMRQRPIGPLVDALLQCGAQISYTCQEGYPPLSICGRRLKAKGAIAMPGNISSQYVSAMMMIAPTIEGGLTIKIEGDLVSRPYVEMTASIMRHFGAEIEVELSEIRIQERGYRPTRLTVENDWSAASYWYELKALMPRLPITLRGLKEDSLQGDRAAAEIFRSFGVTTRFVDGNATLGYTPSLSAANLHIDLGKQPDLAQTVAVTACLRNIPFEITGLSTLRIKETDRIEALRSQLAVIGYAVEASPDSLRWDGQRQTATEHPKISTFDDHRMAMAFAPASLLFPRLTIKDAGVVSKSYPTFWNDFASAGFITEKKA